MTTESPKVLLVDDDPAMLRLLSKWLEAEGYQVIRAADGRAAMEVIEAEHPRILVTDWEMPHVDGLELCRWVRGQSFDHYIYTIFLTVRSHSADILRGLEAGADDFLKKPVDRDELLARIRAGSRVMELEQRLSKLANVDPMTGLATRRTLFDKVQREWRRAARYESPLSCVMIDIDFFKRINDTHGHHVGDDVIRQLGKLLGSGVRDCDIAGRYGGEEFCVVLPETSEQQAMIWAERMRKRVAELRIPIRNSSLSITASFGVAERLADTNTAEQLIDMADQALVAAKRSGRDRVIAYQALTQTAVLDGEDDSLAAQLQKIPARDVMSAIVAPLQEEHTVATAANYFLRFRIPSAPVVNEAGKLVGILSEKDLMSIVLGKNCWQMPIKDVMKRNVVCYEEESSTLAVCEFLSRVAIRGVVIVNGGAPTGLITRSCLLRFVINMLAGRKTDGVSPEVDAAASELVERMGSLNPRARIGQTVHSLVAEAEDLETRLGDDRGELMARVVGGASRIQELIIDLLAISRFADGPASSQAMPTGRGAAQVAGALQFVGNDADGEEPGWHGQDEAESTPNAFGY
jgi:two-component system, cell cycle response regulator